MKKFLLVLLFTIGLLLLFTLKINAQSNSTYSLDLRVNESGSGDFQLNVLLRNVSSDQLINGYEIKLPYKQIGNTSIRLNNKDVIYKITNSDAVSNIKIEFMDMPILPQNIGNLQINFSVSKLINEFYSTKKLFIPLILAKDLRGNIKYAIHFPKSFEDPIFVSSSKYRVQDWSDDSKRIEIETDKGLFFIWGKGMIIDLQSTYNIFNEKKEEVQSLVSLIPDYENQKVLYKEIIGGEYGLVDDVENAFSLVNLEPEKQKEVGFTTRVELRPNNIDSIYPEKYNWALDTNSTEGKNINNELNKSEDTLAKLKNVNDFIVNKLNPYKDEKIDLERVENIWKRLEGSSNFSSFEYCYLMTSAAESIGLKARIDYGYIIFQGNDNADFESPHVWCEAQVDGKNILLDPYMEDLVGITYFNLSQIDRVKFGVWHPNQDYNNALGLIGSSKIKPKLNIINIDRLNDSLPDITMSLRFPESVFSGEYYSGEMSITNLTNNLIRFNSLKLEDENIDGNIKYSKFSLALLPHQVNKIELMNLREKNFFLDGSKQINIEAKLDSEIFPKLAGNTNINFKPDGRLLVIVVSVVVFMIVALVFVIVRLRRISKGSNE